MLPISPQFGSLFVVKVPSQTPEDPSTRIGQGIKKLRLNLLDAWQPCAETYTVDLSPREVVQITMEKDPGKATYHLLSGISQKRTDLERFDVDRRWAIDLISLAQNILHYLFKKPLITRETIADQQLEQQLNNLGLKDSYEKIPFEKAGHTAGSLRW